MLPLFLATCSIVIGLGVVVPILPFYAVAFGASVADVALLFAIYRAAGSSRRRHSVTMKTPRLRGPPRRPPASSALKPFLPAKRHGNP